MFGVREGTSVMSAQMAAPAASVSDLEVLSRKLVGLREEIDAILAQLARHKDAAAGPEPAGAHGAAGADLPAGSEEEPLARLEPPSAPASAWQEAEAGEPPVDEEAHEPARAGLECEGEATDGASPEAEDGALVAAARALAPETADAGPAALLAAGEPAEQHLAEQAPAVEEAPAAQPACAAADTVEPPAAAPAEIAGGDDLTRIAGIDARLAGDLAAIGVTSYGHIAAWTAEDVRRMSAALGLDRQICKQNWIEQAAVLAAGRATAFAAARGSAPAAAAAEAATEEPSPHVAAPAPAAATAPADAAPSAGPVVLSLDARARRQKGPAAPAPRTRGRSVRRIATRIAASILVLLAAATLLALADQVAQGGVPQPPWLPQLPAYKSSAGWPALIHGPARAESSAPAVRLLSGDAAAPRRYQSIWPSGS